ncbi:MAG: sugar phosphate nucleotidyltransferase [Candidatus Shapirobacteria bacterium]
MAQQIFVILCGGTGPRLWPLSTTSHPKQFLSILSSDSLLAQTIKRLLQITDKNNIYITTSNRNVNEITKIALKLIPIQNIIIEPDKKNTALAIFYTLSQFKNYSSDTVVTFLPSDHFISPINKFKNDLLKVAKIASENQSIVTIGIHPSFPNTSFGYILSNHKFVEKPNKLHALKYIINGALWNSGIYTATIKTYFSEFDKHFKNPNYTKSLPLSFDKAISEKTKNIEHIKASFDWSDIGEWGSIFTKSKQDKQHIALVNQDTKFLNQDSHHCLVSSQNSNKLIGLVNVNNLAIIDTPNALLISSLDHSSQVRDLVIKITATPTLKHFFVDDEK